MLITGIGMTEGYMVAREKQNCIVSGRISILSRCSVPEEQSRIARHFNAGIGWKNVESRRDG
jgi:hypothetical protein